MKRKLETIEIQRRFGGWIAVLKFCDGITETVGRNVHQSTTAALNSALDWIDVPAYNIGWWTEN
jgi:hypothetical protein